MIAPNAAEVLNLVGFVTGTALYAMLLALVLRNVPGNGQSRLPLATAVLGLVWNIGELAAYAMPRPRSCTWPPSSQAIPSRRRWLSYYSRCATA